MPADANKSDSGVCVVNHRMHVNMNMIQMYAERLDEQKIGYTSRFVRVILAQGPC